MLCMTMRDRYIGAISAISRRYVKSYHNGAIVATRPCLVIWTIKRNRFNRAKSLFVIY